MQQPCGTKTDGKKPASCGSQKCKKRAAVFLIYALINKGQPRAGRGHKDSTPLSLFLSILPRSLEKTDPGCFINSGQNSCREISGLKLGGEVREGTETENQNKREIIAIETLVYKPSVFYFYVLQREQREIFRSSFS